MKTLILKAFEDGSAIKKGAEIIASGGLVAFPTETVYGLGANGLDPNAAKKIYAAKGRPSDNPLILHICRLSELSELAEEIPEAAIKLAQRFWPGPLTMIFKKKPIVPDAVTGGLDTVAVRMPDHPVAKELIMLSGCPIAAPSANISGRPSPVTAEHVAEDLEGKVDLILDGGKCSVGIESTIVDVTEDIPVILRPGHITLKDLEDVLGEVRIDPAVSGIMSDKDRCSPEETHEHGDAVPRAPGMKYTHYAPKGELLIISGSREKVRDYIKKSVSSLKERGVRTWVIASEETRSFYPEENVLVMGSLTDISSMEKELFKTLRYLDQENAEVIFSESFYTDENAMGLMNRMLKAAGHRIINADEEGEYKC